MGSGYQGQPSRPILNDLSYRDSSRPPGITTVSRIRQVTSFDGKQRVNQKLDLAINTAFKLCQGPLEIRARFHLKAVSVAQQRKIADGY